MHRKLQIIFCAVALVSASWLVAPFQLVSQQAPVARPPQGAPNPPSSPSPPAKQDSNGGPAQPPKPEPGRVADGPKQSEPQQAARPIEVER
jgi:hypothetical protein